MASITLLDVAKNNGSDAVVGLIEESLSATPEMALFPVRTVEGTGFKTLVRTGLPTVNFIAASQGIAGGKSTFDNKHFDCSVLGGRIEVWQSASSGSQGGALRGHIFSCAA